MRNYEDEQKKSVLFEGEQAERLKAIRISMDQQANKICEDLHLAVGYARKGFEQLETTYGDQIQAVLKGTPYAGKSLSDIGFDFSKMETHGFIFAHEQTNPIKQFLDMLEKSVEWGPVPSSDRIYFETVEPTGSVSEQWGAGRKVTEPA